MDTSHASTPTGTLIWIDPRAIRDWYADRGLWDKLRSVSERIGRFDGIRRGGWDRRVIPFHDHPTCRLLQVIDECGYRPERVRQRLGDSFPRPRGKRPRSLSGAEFVRYVDYYQKIARSMRRDGYLPAPDGAHMRIAIARDGRPVKVSGGNHRLALAQLVNLSAVQAEVRFVHSRWRTTAGRVEPAAIPELLEAAGFVLSGASEDAVGGRSAMPRV